MVFGWQKRGYISTGLMVQCPYCRLGDSRVISSREGAGYIRRRRICPACSQRFTTHEQVTHATLP